MQNLSQYSFEIGAIRPPSEGGSCSLLIRTTRNCPWSRCKFCYATFYDREKLQLRPVSEIRQDIDAVKAIGDKIREISRQVGFEGQIDQTVVFEIIQQAPELAASPLSGHGLQLARFRRPDCFSSGCRFVDNANC